MAKCGMWSPDHYIHMWVVPKLLHKVGSTQLSRMSLDALKFLSIRTKGPNPELFLQDNAPVHKVKTMETWFAKVGC